MSESIRKLINDEKLLKQAGSMSFMEYDKNKTGTISKKDLNLIISKDCISLGISKPEHSQLMKFMKSSDISIEKNINFDNYLKILKFVLKKHVEKADGVTETNLENKQKKDDKMERKIKKQIKSFETYLEDTGIPAAFEVIFTEILHKKINPEDVFVYTANRLREIGRDIAHLLPKEYKAN